MPTDIRGERLQHIPAKRLWFGAAGGAVAWALQGFTCFLIATQACANGIGSWGPLSPLGVRILIGCVSAGYLAVSVAAALVAFSNWKALADNRRLLRAEGYGREEYMSLVGVFVGVATTVGLIWAGIPPIFFEVCNTFR